MNIFFTVVLRDVRLAMRRKSEVLNSVFFFAVVATLFPLAIGPEPAMLRQIGPGVLWVVHCWLPCWVCRACLRAITATAVWNTCCCPRIL